MSGHYCSGCFFCDWWGCNLENVTEWQQDDCEKNGMDCYTCMDQANATSDGE